ncbi:MAG: UDP-N-acetylmuramoyl-tripeptide--D-alanyl-D-alanine ligase [Patescibacteria group bacterium]|nr:UDP-N-acetylmuramoyl-tripeptide--D-alanyl-D-alanine ligase [Patescibacteria group bacterium]
MIIILQKILKVLSKAIIRKYRPEIIAVTGSVGKTSAKRTIFSVLSNMNHLTLIDKMELCVRSSEGNFNNELGVPLTIIGDWAESDLKLVSRGQPKNTKKIQKTFFWLKVILTGIFEIIFRNRKYPRIIILEFGADRPGDIKYLLKIAKPKLGIITAIGDIPVHVEFYDDVEDVVKEKLKIVEALPSSGFAVLNCDDEMVMKMKDKTGAQAITFGFNEEADMKISNFENYSVPLTSLGQAPSVNSEQVSSVIAMAGRASSRQVRPGGISFKIEYKGSFVPVNLKNVFGKAQAYSVASAFAIGTIYGLNLVEIAELIERHYIPAKQRMNLIEGIKETWIIDDSYNASPLSIKEALMTLGDLESERKIAVLGDMLELGKYSIEAHEDAGKMVREVADILITVGPRGKFIAEKAKLNGMSYSSVFSFDTVNESLKTIQDLSRPGDLILVKASRAIGLDKVVEEIRKM